MQGPAAPSIELTGILVGERNTDWVSPIMLNLSPAISQFRNFNLWLVNKPIDKIADIWLRIPQLIGDCNVEAVLEI